jgi:hypothetical protein
MLIISSSKETHKLKISPMGCLNTWMKANKEAGSTIKRITMNPINPKNVVMIASS